MCIGSAIAISKILVLYETRYIYASPYQYQGNLKTSSAILLRLLFAAVTKYPAHSQSEIASYLSSCFRALDEFALSLQSARRAKDLLVNLQQQWEIRTRFSRDSRNPKRNTYLPRKRSRWSNKIYRITPMVPEKFMSGRREPEMDFHVGSEPDWMPVESVLDNCNKEAFEVGPGSGLNGPHRPQT